MGIRSRGPSRPSTGWRRLGCSWAAGAGAAGAGREANASPWRAALAHTCSENGRAAPVRIWPDFCIIPRSAGPAARVLEIAAARAWGPSAPRERCLAGEARLPGAEAAWAWREESQAWGWGLVDRPRIRDGRLQDVGFDDSSSSS